MITTKEPHIMAHVGSSKTAEECQHYSWYWGDLLMGQVEYRQPEAAEKAAQNHWLNLKTADPDLFIFSEPAQSRLKRWLFGSPARQIAHLVPTSFLLVRQPRWPIRNILLVLRSELGDETAVDWVRRIVQFNRASVTILPIIPSIPAMYATGSYAHLGLDVWAALENSLETDLGRLAHWLISRHTDVTLRVRLGDPHWQIRQEVNEGNYDLIVIPTEPYSRLSAWFLGELVGPLLDWTDRPVMVIKLPLSA